MTHRSSPVTDDQYRKKPVLFALGAWDRKKRVQSGQNGRSEMVTITPKSKPLRGPCAAIAATGSSKASRASYISASLTSSQPLSAYEPASAPAQCAPTDPLTDLVERFSKALLAKLRLAEANGRSGWDRDDWEKQCQEGLLRHVDKGDPRDVAAYCAFMWHHGWITALTSTPRSRLVSERHHD
jgi:hypothetical protein